MNAASCDETGFGPPLPVVSAANRIFWLTNRFVPATPCATLAASAEVIAVLGPPGFVGLIVYDPEPNPVNVYAPGVPVMTGPTAGEPEVLCSVTFLMNRGGGGLLTGLPYVITPLIDGVLAGVGVSVAVDVFVAVDVGVGVSVAVGVGVGVSVFVAVGVGVFVAVSEGVAAGPNTTPIFSLNGSPSERNSNHGGVFTGTVP